MNKKIYYLLAAVVGILIYFIMTYLFQFVQ